MFYCLVSSVRLLSSFKVKKLLFKSSLSWLKVLLKSLLLGIGLLRKSPEQ